MPAAPAALEAISSPRGYSIRLLPIETRAASASTTELKRYPDEWHVTPLDVTDGPSLVDAFARVREVKRVPVEEAKHYGLFLEEAELRASGLAPDGMVEIPRWRHAVINFPHPLLDQGLREAVNDPLGPAVVDGGHGGIERRHFGDAQPATHFRDALS